MSFMISSCGEEFLYKEPLGSVDPETMQNATAVNMLITGAYSQLTIGTRYTDMSANWVYDVLAGAANKGSHAGDQENEYMGWQEHTLTSSNPILSFKYQMVYRGSKRVETALQILANVTDMNATLLAAAVTEGIDMKAIRQGELHFLRALYYFEGARVFGPYILYLDETNTEADPRMHNDVSIWPKIEHDINEAIRLLDNYPRQNNGARGEIGRAYKWAAIALKVKILMQQGKNAEAKPLLLDLLANGHTAWGTPYGLRPDLRDTWSIPAKNSGGESIFDVQYVGERENAGSGWSLAYVDGGPGGCCGFFHASFDLANSFQVDDDGLPFLDNEYRSRPSIATMTTTTTAEHDFDIPVDPRLDFNVIRTGLPFKDWGVAPSGRWNRDIGYAGPFKVGKFIYTDADRLAGQAASNLHPQGQPGSAMNLPYITVRDMMLRLAEIHVEDNELPQAMALVNAIRKRAANPTLINNTIATYNIAEYPGGHAAFSNQDVARKAVRMERKLELALEGGISWFDYIRWGGDYMSTSIQAAFDYEGRAEHLPRYADYNSFPPEVTFLPLPQTQVIRMGQNPATGQNWLQQRGYWVNR